MSSLNACGCCGGNVLIWDESGNVYADTILGLQVLYQAMGLTVHTKDDWTTDINDYRLIIWTIATKDAVWWPTIRDGAWSGRIHITAENATFFQSSIDYLNSISGITQITLSSETIDVGCTDGLGNPWAGPTEPDDLTEGQTTIFYAATTGLSGGTVLCRTQLTAEPWIARNDFGNIDFVIVGDSNHFGNSCPAHLAHNTRFFQNLWNVPI